MTDHIMEVNHVTVSFDGFKVLDDLQFSINYGELRFLIGPNGAGKSTLLDIMTGKTRPDQRQGDLRRTGQRRSQIGTSTRP